MEFVYEEGKQHHDECSTLIVPALSVGNVGQLAVDLLVSSMVAERIGYFDDIYVLPCVGNDAYEPTRGHLVLPLEAYDSESNAVTLIQQRSPVIKGMMIDFSKSLADFAVTKGMKHVVVLSSLEFRKWQKIDMSSGLPIFYLSSRNENGSDELCEQLGWKRLEEYDPRQRCWEHLNSLVKSDDAAALARERNFILEDEVEEDEYYYPSLPFAALFSSFKERGLRVTCVLCYCSEGDNTSDASCLAEATCRLLGLHPAHFHPNRDGGQRWKIPFSWNTLYGPPLPPDSSMF